MSKDFPLLPGESVRRLVFTISRSQLNLLSTDQEEALHWRMVQCGRVERKSEGMVVWVFHRVKAYQIMSVLTEVYYLFRATRNRYPEEDFPFLDYNNVLLGGIELSVRQDPAPPVAPVAAHS